MNLRQYSMTSFATFITFITAFAILQIDGISIYCKERGLRMSNGTMLCPAGSTFNDEFKRCCKETPFFSGQRPSRTTQHDATQYTSCFPALKPKAGGTPRCPRGGRYDSRLDQCCFPSGTTLDDSPSGVVPSLRGNCVDKKPANGNVTECPANKEKCDDPLWYNFMTEQCPKTCGRCNRAAGVCEDGMNRNDRSECPSSRELCNHPSYSEFMRLECPRTCGMCT